MDKDWEFGMPITDYHCRKGRSIIKKLQGDSEIAAVRPIINRLAELEIRTPKKGEIERIIAESVRFESGCRPDPEVVAQNSNSATIKRWVTPDELKKMYPEPIRYPEEVKMDGIKAQLRREMAKGKVYGNFC